LWSGLIGDDVASSSDAASTTADVGVLGAPFDGGVSFRRGTAFAPARLRELSTHMACCADEGQPLRLRVRDYGDVPPDLDWSRYFRAV
jgi:agmatinase